MSYAIAAVPGRSFKFNIATRKVNRVVFNLPVDGFHGCTIRSVVSLAAASVHIALILTTWTAKEIYVSMEKQ